MNQQFFLKLFHELNLTAIFTFILFCMFIILILSFFLRRRQVQPIGKLPAFLFWRIIYTDQKEKNKKSDIDYGITLYSAKYDLQGKPDYVYKHKITGQIMPVEIKSGISGGEPHDGDLMQVGAYFLILSDVYNKRPKKAYIAYKDETYIIRNTAQIRNETKSTAIRMRQMLQTGSETANPSFVGCRHCICNGTVCEFCNYNSKKE